MELGIPIDGIGLVAAKKGPRFLQQGVIFGIAQGHKGDEGKRRIPHGGFFLCIDAAIPLRLSFEIPKAFPDRGVVVPNPTGIVQQGA